jgi:hypothetical protein
MNGTLGMIKRAFQISKLDRLLDRVLLGEGEREELAIGVPQRDDRRTRFQGLETGLVVDVGLDLRTLRVDRTPEETEIDRGLPVRLQGRP